MKTTMLTTAEKKLLNALIESGIAPIECQQEVADHWTDLTLPEKKIAIQIDGVHYSTTPSSIAADQRSDHELQQAGWRVLRFTDKEVEEATEAVIAVIKRLYENPSH